MSAGGPEEKAKAAVVLEHLMKAHPEAHCELVYGTVFQLLCATVLSAQTTDVAVNKATPALFARYPDAQTLARADVTEIEPLLATIGMYRQKAKHLVGLSRRLVEYHQGQVPSSLEELVALPGVGRKTANVVLGVAFGAPAGVIVDTHVQRIAQRLGWTRSTNPEQIEQELSQLLPQKAWDQASHTLVFQGRRICFARKPNCAGCSVHPLCPSAFHAEKVGRKPSRVRK